MIVITDMRYEVIFFFTFVYISYATGTYIINKDEDEIRAKVALNMEQFYSYSHKDVNDMNNVNHLSGDDKSSEKQWGKDSIDSF